MSLTDAVKRVLVLAPHTDDGEIGAGGTISLLLEKGADVHYAVFSLCEESLDEKYPRDMLRREQLEAAASLGLPEENVLFFRFPVRKFPDHRQEILEERHVRAKAKACTCYESQRERPYADEGFFLSLARCRGVQIGREYAEAFETVRWIF